MRGHKTSWCRPQQPQRTESEAQPVESGKDKKKVQFQGCKLNKRLDGLVELKRQLQAGETTVSAMSKTDVTDWLIIQNKKVWGLDSCSEEHSTSHLDILTDVKNIDETAPEFQFGNSATQVPSNVGKVIVTVTNEDGEKRELELSSVYYLPESPCNLLSTGAIREKGHRFHQPPDKMSYVLFGDEFKVPALETGRVPLLVGRPPKKASLVSRRIWHRRLGHVGSQHLDQLAKFVDGLNIDDGDNTLDPCDACPAGKSKTPPFPKQSRNPTTAPNQFFHTDLSGIMSGDIQGHRYAHIMVDDYTREGMLNLLHFKSDAAKTLDKWIRRFDSPGAVRSDLRQRAPRARGAWAERCEYISHVLTFCYPYK